MTNKVLVLVLSLVFMCAALSARDNEYRHKKSVMRIVIKTQKNFKSFVVRKKYGNRVKKHILIN